MSSNLVKYSYDPNSYPVKTTIEESPYGDKGVTYVGSLGLMDHLILQLKSYRVHKKTDEQREHLEIDIAAYEEIKAKGSEKIAELFMDTKSEAYKKGVPFKNNRAVIDEMKAKGLWK